MSEREPSQQGIPAEPNASAEPHDVLAAEEFAIPAPEAARSDRPVTLPPEPNPSAEAHDVLAAEEFAMPAPSGHVTFDSAPGDVVFARRGYALEPRTLVALGLLGALLGALVAALARRR